MVFLSMFRHGWVMLFVFVAQGTELKVLSGTFAVRCVGPHWGLFGLSLAWVRVVVVIIIIIIIIVFPQTEIAMRGSYSFSM